MLCQELSQRLFNRIQEFQIGPGSGPTNGPFATSNSVHRLPDFGVDRSWHQPNLRPKLFVVISQKTVSGDDAIAVLNNLVGKVGSIRQPDRIVYVKDPLSSRKIFERIT